MGKSVCCVVEDGKPCPRPHAARGYCGMHHQRLKKHGDPLVRSAPKPDIPKPKRPCSIQGCGKSVKALGWCSMHWKRAKVSGGDPQPDRPQRAAKTPERAPYVQPDCSEAACVKPAKSLGLCLMHYTRMRRYGTTSLPARPPRKQCTLADCERTLYAKGYCNRHYERLKRWGDPNAGEFWITGEYRLDKNGYRTRVKTRDGVRKKEFEHRVVMSEMLGRDLLPNEEVHHRNTIRDDNRPDNLELWRESTRKRGARAEDLIEYVTDFHLAAAIARALANGRREELLLALKDFEESDALF